MQITDLSVTTENFQGKILLTVTHENAGVLEQGLNLFYNAGITSRHGAGLMPEVTKGETPRYRIETTEKRLARGLRAIANTELYPVRSLVTAPNKKKARVDKSLAYCAEVDARANQIFASFGAPVQVDDAKENNGDVVQVDTHFLCNLSELARTLAARGFESEF